jgi:large subunit GTPase 1
MVSFVPMVFSSGSPFQPPRRDLNPSGLGRAIINRKAKDAKRMQESGLVSSLDILIALLLTVGRLSMLLTLTQHPASNPLHKKPIWMNFSIPLNWLVPTLQRVRTLLSSASFHPYLLPERRNVKIIQQSAGSSQNPYLLSEQEEITTLKKHQENKTRLRVPRRPAWTKSMTPAELEQREKTAFLDWRRGLARYDPSYYTIQGY